MSRDITPLPSVSSSRTATRHASLLPDGTFDQDSIQRICEKIDAGLEAAEAQTQPTEFPYTYGYSHSRPASSKSASPTLASESPRIGKYDGFDDRLTYTPTVESKRSQRPVLNAVITWTSNATRRAEYEKIDRAQSGLKGFLRRASPKCLQKKNCRRGFFEGPDDADSVRRFRLEVSDDDSGSEVWAGEENQVTEIDEKTPLRSQNLDSPKPGVKSRKPSTKKDKIGHKRWLSCFHL